jgi:hypothetical protein
MAAAALVHPVVKAKPNRQGLREGGGVMSHGVVMIYRCIYHIDLHGTPETLGSYNVNLQ